MWTAIFAALGPLMQPLVDLVGKGLDAWMAYSAGQAKQRADALDRAAQVGMEVRRVQVERERVPVDDRLERVRKHVGGANPG